MPLRSAPVWEGTADGPIVDPIVLGVGPMILLFGYALPFPAALCGA